MESRQLRLVTVNPYLLWSADQPASLKSARARVNALLKSFSDSGVTGVAWHSCVCGRALYRTSVASPFKADPRRRGRRVEALFSKFDFLDSALESGRKYGLDFMVVCRPYDDYFPGLGSAFEAGHQHMLWESRDGEFRLRGVLSLAYDEVSRYRLEVLAELCAYRPDGIIIDINSGAASMTPFRRRDFFGFNAPIAQEHFRLHAQDIRAFDRVQYRRASDLQVVDAVYSGGDFNRDGWHAVKGAFFEKFLRNAAAIVKSDGRRLAFLRGSQDGILPIARLALPADKWLAEGLIDDLILPYGPADDGDLTAYLEARGRGQRVITGCPPAADGSIEWFSTDNLNDPPHCVPPA